MFRERCERPKTALELEGGRPRVSVWLRIVVSEQFETLGGVFIDVRSVHATYPSPEFRRRRPSVESALIVPFSARAAMLLHPEAKRQQSDVPDRSRTRRPDPSSRQQQQEPTMTRGLFNDCGVPSSRQALQFCPHLPTCLDDFASRLADARK
jgi:hypothetical protein